MVSRRAQSLVMGPLDNAQSLTQTGSHLPAHLHTAFRTITQHIQYQHQPCAIFISGCGEFQQSRLAQAVGHWLLCQKRSHSEATEACLQCQGCGWAQQGCHPDLLHIDGSLSGGVEALRDQLSVLNLSPRQVPFHVVLIARIERLTPEAIQILLKPLEETHWPTYWLLTSDNGSVFPQTFLSRLQQFQFLPLSEQVLLKWAKILSPDASAFTLQTATRLACGAPLTLCADLQISQIRARHQYLNQLVQACEDPIQLLEAITWPAVEARQTRSAKFFWTLAFWLDCIKLRYFGKRTLTHLDYWDHFYKKPDRSSLVQLQNETILALWRSALRACRETQLYPYVDRGLIWATSLTHQVLILNKAIRRKKYV